MAIPDEPLTREETYLAKAAGQSVNLPEPVTRREMYLKAIAENGGGGGGGASITVDNELSDTSTNPVQNRAIFSALDSKVEMDAMATLVYFNRNGTSITMVDSRHNFTAIFNLFSSAFKTYFVLPLSQYDMIIFEIVEVDAANRRIYLVGYSSDLSYMYRIVLTQGSDSSAAMTGTITEYSLITNSETISGTTPSIAIADNTVFSAGTLTSLTVTGSLTEGQACTIVFTSGSTATQLTLPVTLLMPDSFAVEANKVYEISIMGNRGAVQSWSTT